VPESENPAAQEEPGARVAALRNLVREQRFPEVLTAGASLLAVEPGQRDALLCVAVAQRYLQRVPDALTTLTTLEQHHPRFSRLYEERGRCFVDLRQAPEAIQAFLTAVNLNHALPGSWAMLEGLYRMTGETRNAGMAAAHVATLRKVPPEVVVATGLFMDGDLDAAEALVRAWLLKHGDHVEAMRLLARIGIARKIYDDPELLLAAVLARAPGYRAAREEYARVLVELHKHEAARSELETLLRDAPDNRALRLLEAASAAGLGENERALELYRALLTGDPLVDAEVHLSTAHALRVLGRSAESIEAYRTAARCRGDFGDAYWSLANLKTYRFSDAELAAIRAALEAPGTRTEDRYHLCFALAKALEDRGEFEESWRHYAQGNALKRPECRYRPEIIEGNSRAQIEVCTAEFFASRRGWGAPASDPIFIIGLPRSGSTLIEQILASHSRVEGTQELPNVQQIVTALRGHDHSNDRYPRILAELGAEDCERLGAKYLSETRAYRRSGRPLFIDKMPNNFRHLGLIHLMLPNARIIDARREPLACCFSNLKQLFANGQEFTYSIEDIARYYRTYLELMRHWERVLPGRILRVQHEEVVEDLEGNVRRVLDFCGLEFEPQCLAFHQTQRTVRTASSEQVRQALNREGLEQWKNFEPWLGSLHDALGDAMTRYRETADGHEAGSQRSVPVR
jgi:tetratricopeptide (TPR) repeat protein